MECKKKLTPEAEKKASLKKIEDSLDILGKRMSDFSDDLTYAIEGSTIKASGSLKKVTDFTAFDTTHPELQNGYYLPFTVTPPEVGNPVSIQVDGKPEVSSPEDNSFLVFLGADLETGKSKSIKVKAGSETYTMDLSALTAAQ